MTRPKRILLTNDDGIDAPGLSALEAAFGEMPGLEVWVVAPDSGRSACSHGITLSRPLFVQECGLRRYAVDGLPADCVYLALFGLMPDKPDVVVSGVNNGANLGQDVIYSGTVAGAREAALRGVHGVAASLVEGERFDAVAANIAGIALELAAPPVRAPLILNLNYPSEAFKGPMLGPLGSRSYPEIVTARRSPGRELSYYWIGGPPVQDDRVPGSDGWLIGHGIASATLLSLDHSSGLAMAQAGELLPFIEMPEDG